MRVSISLFSFATILNTVQAVESSSNRLPLFLYVDRDAYKTTPEVMRDEFIKMADNGVSTIILAFYLTDIAQFAENVADFADQWKKLGSDKQLELRDELHKRGTNILISAGGATEGGNWLKHGATEYGKTFCSLAKELNLDGVDFDLENVGAIDFSVSAWLHESAKSCKSVFPEAIITSAPQTPYFMGGGSHGHGWDDILLDGLTDGSAHDHLLIQYYNQGSWYAANTYDTIFGTTKQYSIGYLMKTYPDSPSKTFVVGKPWSTEDGAAADWVDPQSLREMGCRAWKEIHWRGGFMFWQHHIGASDATFAAYKALTEPCDGASDDTQTTTTRPTDPATRPTNPRTRPTNPATRPTNPRTRPTSPRTQPTSHPTRPTNPATRPTNPATRPTPNTTQHITAKRTTRRPIVTTHLRTGSTESSTETTPKIESPIVKECKSKVVGVQPQFDIGCQNLCEWYGGDGAAQCARKPADSEGVVDCLTSLNTWCTKE